MAPAATATTDSANPTPAATAPSATTPGPDLRPEPGYLDDRSGPEQVLRSYVDAINRKEYARAYSYWEAGVATSQLPPVR